MNCRRERTIWNLCRPGLPPRFPGGDADRRCHSLKTAGPCPRQGWRTLMPAVQETIDRVRMIDVDQYKYGFETLIETDKAPKGLNEDIIRFISAKKGEPEWMTEWRLNAYKRWLTMQEPTWARVSYPKIDFQDIHYYAAPKNQDGPRSLD